MKTLRGFLGLCRYHRGFVPLTTLLWKDAFVWTDDATKAFQKLQMALMQTPVFQLPNSIKLFIIQTDASGTGIRVVLIQDDYPLAYFSRSLLPDNKRHPPMPKRCSRSWRQLKSCANISWEGVLLFIPITRVFVRWCIRQSKRRSNRGGFTSLLVLILTLNTNQVYSMVRWILYHEFIGSLVMLCSLSHGRNQSFGMLFVWTIIPTWTYCSWLTPSSRIPVTTQITMFKTGLCSSKVGCGFR